MLYQQGIDLVLDTRFEPEQGSRLATAASFKFGILRWVGCVIRTMTGLKINPTATTHYHVGCQIYRRLVHAMHPT